MTRARPVQYTLRNVSPAVDRALRQKARELRQSLNTVALDALALGAGVHDEARRYHDLDQFFGSWVEDAATDRALEEQRQVDEDLWR